VRYDGRAGALASGAARPRSLPQSRPRSYRFAELGPSGLAGHARATLETTLSHSTEIERRYLATSQGPLRRPVIDTHVHAVDFNQRSDGLERLIERMDQANAAKAVVFGLPVKKKWDAVEPIEPHYYLDDNAACYYFSATDEIVAQQYLLLDDAKKARLAPMICGLNPTDRNAVDHLQHMHGKYPFWRGVGELLLRHDDLTNLTKEETARANHPALAPVFEFCCGHDLPVLVHQNSTSVWIHDAFEYLHELEEALAAFPALTLVWAHCGISRRVSHKSYPSMLREMLRAHEHLCVDLSWVVYDDVVCRGAPADALVPHRTWLDLIRDFPDRFMIGSDLVGHFEHLDVVLGRYQRLMDELGSTVADQVAVENAERIWFRS
jgi:hypothetical protein